MKKLLKVSNWDTTTAFTTENVDNESHWYVAGMKRALTLLGIGDFVIEYNSATSITIQTTLFGNFKVERPTLREDGPYLFYVNSEDKELWGGSCLTQTREYENQVVGTSPANCVRGLVRAATTGQTSSLQLHFVGGVLQLKFENGIIKGMSKGEKTFGIEGQYTTPAQIGIILPDNYIANASPLTAVSLNYTKMSIVNSPGVDSRMHFDGEYFESIYLCDKYYLGGLRSDDATKFVFDGYLFIVDNANDIEIIETTI